MHIIQKILKCLYLDNKKSCIWRRWSILLAKCKTTLIPIVGLLFNAIVITHRNVFEMFYNNLHDHHTQANKQIITKRVSDNYPCRCGISKTLIRSFSESQTSSLWDLSMVDCISLDLLCYSPSQGVISVWALWSISRTLKQLNESINWTCVFSLF